MFIVCCAGLLLLGAAIWIWRKHAVESRSLARYNAVREKGLVIPATLHPVFDPNRCIGSGACTRICPQGNEVIGRIGGRGVLIDPSMCIGHGKCAAECPMGAIRLVFGTSERGVDLPHLSPSFETNVEGLYITGELGGMGLIANAVRQAKAGMEGIRRALAKAGPRASSETASDVSDVIIVGAGPAGFTAALFAIENGLSYRLFDKEPEVGGAIHKYPRRKIVMTHPVEMPLLGRVHRKNMTKEELVDLWKSAVADHRIVLESGAAVDMIEKGEDGVFTVKGPGFSARGRTVMLTVGRRGTPRRLGVPGEDGPNVFYGMLEPETHEGRRVLVVGGGDSAVEAACSLVEETDATVTLSYRGEALTKIKAQNRERFESLVREGRLTALLKSQVKEIGLHETKLAVGGETRSLPVDDVIVLIGGELPTALLQRIGVHIERHFGDETEAHKQTVDLDIFHRIRAQSRAVGLKNFHKDDTGKRRTAAMLVALFCIAALATIFYYAKDFYLIRAAGGEMNDTLSSFKASGLFGHSLGVVAAVLMLVNLSYFARKEIKSLAGAGDLRTWMLVHQASGLTAAGLVVLHTALLLNNAFATALYIGLAAVVSSGIAGRYLFSMVPHDPRGRPLTHEALTALCARMEKEYQALFGDLDATIEIRKILDLTHRIRLSIPLLTLHLLFVWPVRFLRLTSVIRRARREVGDGDRRRAFKRFSIEMFRLRFQMDLAPKLKAVLSTWRMGHAVFALLTVGLVTAHIVVEAWVGYKWIF